MSGRQWHPINLCGCLVSKAAKVLIKNVVALGLGSLHQAYDGQHREFDEDRAPIVTSFGTSVQLTVVMKIREVLGGMQLVNSDINGLTTDIFKDNGKMLPCIAQDPVYSPLDKPFLRSMDITVVDDPDAFSLIDENSLVFLIGTFPRILWWIGDRVLPAAIITEKGYDDLHPCQKGSLPPYVEPDLRKMLQQYDVDDRFSEEYFHQYEITKLYVRKDVSGDLKKPESKREKELRSRQKQKNAEISLSSLALS